MNTTSSQWRPLQEDGGQREWRVQIDVPEAENNDPTWSDWIHLVFGAVRRRWLLFGILFLSGMTASLQYYRSRPPLYRTEARIFAQPPQPLSGPAHPTIADDVPTHQAWNLVHQRKNLIELIKEAKLLEPWRARTRQNHQWWSRWLPFQRAEEDSLNDLVGELDQDLLVTTAEETIRISIDWPDPEEAYRIVHGALQNFFEARHLKEITAFDEVISLLRGRAAALREQLDKVVQESRGVSSQGWEFTNTSNAASRKPVEELERLRATIDAKNRAIWDVEEFRRRR
ncbi:MAG TPA: hypothetical protein VMK12_20960, partial [Anaeromyxobacteraceae bacterium]|nr:hypothetical protein [Anaeromyxobacteraceae bacterium]